MSRHLLNGAKPWYNGTRFQESIIHTRNWNRAGANLNTRQRIRPIPAGAWFVPVLFILSALGFVPGPACADGVSFGETLMFEEVSQTVVITCGQDREIMLLATGFQSDVPVENQVWIVPIFSQTPPVVEAVKDGFFDSFDWLLDSSAMAVFPDFVFRGRVIVHEKKELGIYDLAVLEPDSVVSLVSWLNKNGYAVPESIHPLLSEYIQKGAYFIANRIDLANVFSRELDILKNDNPGFSEAKRTEQAFISLSFHNKLKIELFYMTNSITYNDSAFGKVFTEYDLKELRELDGITQRDIKNENEKSKAYHDLLSAANSKYHHNFMDNDFAGYTKSADYSQSPAYAYLTNQEFADLANAYQDYRDARDKTAASSQEARDRRNQLAVKIEPFERLGETLAREISTPIKITFKPEECFFPLRISSGAPESPMLIAAAVYGQGPLEDRNGVLSMNWETWSNGVYTGDRFVPITPGTNYFKTLFEPGELDEFDTISLIVMNAVPSQLTDDAVFTAADVQIEEQVQVTGEAAGEQTSEQAAEEQDAFYYELVQGYNLIGNPFAESLCAADLGVSNHLFYVYDPADNPVWHTSECLAPCEAGFIKLETQGERMSIAQKPFVDQAGCETAFQGKAGWRLVARPEFFPSARIGAGPFNFSTTDFTGRRGQGAGYSATTSVQIGSGYWVFFQGDE